MQLAAFQHWAAKPKNLPPKGFSGDEAKAEFKSMKASLEKTSEHLAKAEVYAVRTPNLGGVEPPQ